MDLKGAPQGYQLDLHESHKLAQRCRAWLPWPVVLHETLGLRTCIKEITIIISKIIVIGEELGKTNHFLSL